MRRYEEYKNSDVAWFGEIPKNWKIARLKDFSVNVKTGTTPSSSKGDFFENGTENWYTPSDINNSLIINSSRKLSKYAFDIREVQKFPANCIYLIGIGGTLGKVGFSNVEASCNQQINVIQFNKNYDFKYGFYLMLVIGNTLIKWSNYTTMPIFTQTNTKNLLLIAPPFSEQQAIANYLDAKTQAIDKKISLLEQKIETYKRLKRTLINQTITKGLDKNVPLKDSDVSYISKIPSDWKIERIKDLFKIGRGRVIGQLELVEDGKYPVYSSQTENNGCLGYIDTYDFDGDLLTWTTDGANAGTVFRRSGKFNCTNVCGTLKPIRNNLDLNYMVYALQESAIHNKRIDTNGAKIMNNEMALIKVPLPPKSEQEEIAKYLDHKTATIDAIVSNIGKQIDTLKQLRKTLINDVVTGKIKVVE